MRTDIGFDDPKFDHRHYDPQVAYAQAKTANSLFAIEATRLWASEGIVANTVNPGGVATGLQRNFTTEQKASLDTVEMAGVFTYKTIEQGAAAAQRLCSMSARRPTPSQTTPASPTIPTE